MSCQVINNIYLNRKLMTKVMKDKVYKTLDFNELDDKLCIL